MIVSPNHSQNNWKLRSGVRIEALRPIARRQIYSLMRRLAKSGKYQLYNEEIRKVISYEKSNSINTHERENVD